MRHADNTGSASGATAAASTGSNTSGAAPASTGSSASGAHANAQQGQQGSQQGQQGSPEVVVASEGRVWLKNPDGTISDGGARHRSCC
jgi:hypothetical protein